METVQPEASTAPAEPAAQPVPWVTYGTCAIVVAVFVGVIFDDDPLTAVQRWGYRSAFDVWRGAIWSLVTSAFVHAEVWHIGLNLWWLWMLGRVVEPLLGAPRMLALVVAGAFVSSAVQLAGFSEQGIGGSGVVYALFGVAWAARASHPPIRAVLSNQLVAAALIWLVAGWVIAFREFGNGAHLGGLLFGGAAGLAFVSERLRRRARFAMGALVVFSLIAATICPWSAVWWATKGFERHERGAYAFAVEAYQLSLELDPTQSWVLRNLVLAQRGAGQTEAADASLARLRAMAPKEAKELENGEACAE